jgi:hypothetical protein
MSCGRATLRSPYFYIGALVVSVIHQPRFGVFAKFDELILLTSTGHQVYRFDTALYFKVET